MRKKFEKFPKQPHAICRRTRLVSEEPHPNHATPSISHPASTPQQPLDRHSVVHGLALPQRNRRFRPDAQISIPVLLSQREDVSAETCFGDLREGSACRVGEFRAMDGPPDAATAFMDEAMVMTTEQQKVVYPA